MKIQFVALLLAGFCAIPACAQDKAIIFDKKAPVTWLGLDFSQAKLIGDRERLGSESDIRHLIESWNQLILDEPNKFDIARSIGKLKVENAIRVTKENNAELEVLELYSDDVKDYLRFRPGDIDAIVAGYDFKGLRGVGLMFNIESFSKHNQEASVWVTFINMDTRRVIFTERLTGAPKGFGMRNYWAGAIYGILEKMKRKEFEMWRKKHA